jgi:PAS domain S-box-containing protein
METASLFDLLVEQVVDYGIFVLDRDGRIATWNPGAQRIKGYSADEIIGQPYSIFFTDEDRQAGKPGRILQEVRSRGRFQEEGWRVRKDGARFWASVVVTALHDRQGNLKGFAKITRDLTDRMKQEEDARRAAADRAARRQTELYEQRIRRTRDELELILKSIAEGVVVQSLDGLVFTNDTAARMCGFASAEEMMAAPPGQILRGFDIRQEDGTPFPLDRLPGQRALRGEPSTAVVRFRPRSGGGERWSIISAAPISDANGNVDRSVSILREFTDRRRTEEAWQFLAEASAILGSSLDYEETMSQVARLAVPEMADWCSVEVLGPDGGLRQLAVAHVDPAKLALAKFWRDRWPPPEDSMIQRVLRSGKAELLAEITDEMIAASTQEPAQRDAALALGLRSAIVAPLIVGHAPFGVVTFIAAESGRRYSQDDLRLATEVALRASLAVENARAYSEARAAIEVRDNFLSIASHELRTPLSGLTVLMTSLLRAAERDRLTQLGPDAIKARLAKAERQMRQIVVLVDRLLDMSRLSSHDMQLDLAPMDLGELARDVVSRLEDAAADVGGSIELVVGEPCTGRWDRGRLDQVITNLVTNAIKYGGGSPITVSVGGTGVSERARLTVRDRGPGIPEEHQERIFGQFERAATPSSPGMGLGLWLVRRIVTAHGGAVTLTSSPGQGATFNVVLPLDPQRAHLENGAS